MDRIPEIDVDAAKARLDAGDATFMDVRDPHSFAAAHVPGAKHVGDHNVRQFLDDEDKGRCVIVYCYKGMASLGGAAYLLEHGFSEVYSMTGGFDAWRGRLPEEAGEG